MSELVDLFNRDPLSLTKDDEAIKQAIEAYRAMRFKFNLGDTRAGTVKPKAPKANPTLATLLEGGMEFEDMINLTLRGGTLASINPTYIVSIEDLPAPKGDTKVTLYSGTTYIVKEKREAILALIDKGGKK